METWNSGQFGRSVSVPLLAGDQGTEQTINLIRQAVHAGLSNPTVRATAGGILRTVPAYADRAAVEAIFNWVHRNIRFTGDPVGHETISSPDWTIEHRIGDCDDINAVLLPTLLMVVGYPVQLVTISDDPGDPGQFSHVYAEVLLDGRWVPLDAARPRATFGTTISRSFRKRVWSLTSRQYQDVAGSRGGLNGVAVRRSGMGFDFSALSNIISSGAQAAGGIISSIRLPSYPGVYTSSQQPPPPAPAPPATAISPVLLLGGLGLLGVAIIAMKK